MDSNRFDRLARSLCQARTRRAALQALLGPVVGPLPLVALSPGAAEAGKSRKRRRRKRRKKGQCAATRPCRQPGNPCLEAVCEARACVELPRADGTVCAAGRACASGECVCPNGVCVRTVRSGDLNGWDIALESEVAFVPGPESPPLGTGSVQISTVEVTTSALANQDFADRPIGQIETLAYTTFVVNGGATGAAVPRIRLEVLTGSLQEPETTLVFDPANTENADVVAGEWQTWDALGADGRWWTSDAIPGMCAESCLANWAQVLAAIPNATILGGIFVELNTGTHEPDGAVANVDAVRIYDVLYDFEPEA